MYTDLNQKQLEILLYIKGELQKKGYPPSVREICDAVHLKSTSTVHTHLQKLQDKKYIRKDPTKPRAIEVLNNSEDEERLSGRNILEIPLVGEVTAGLPILAVENIEDLVPLPANWFHEGEHFMLRVKGDSMIDAGILDRDYIVVKRCSAASNGDVVVALVDDNEATVKRFFSRQGQIILHPENAAYDDIIPETVSILGIVSGLIRRY